MKQLIALFTLVVLTFTTTLSANAKAKKCSDFRTHSQAQAYYKKLKATKQTGWKSMDRNKDGVACEGLLKGKKSKKAKSKKKAKSSYTKKSTKASKYDKKKLKKDKKAISKAKKAKMKAKMKKKKLKKKKAK